MATDPIRRIRERAHVTPLDLDAEHALVRFADLPPSDEAPYLTVYVDWRPQGSDPGREPAPEQPRSRRRGAPAAESVSRRPGRRQIERELADILERHGPRGAAFDSLSADAELLASYFDELDPSAQGAIVIACAERGVFETLALGLPVPTRVGVGPTPALFDLAYLADDHPTYAVLVADQHDATVTLIDQATARRSVQLESNEYPRRQQTGGWSQRRFKARAGERVAAFARGIAEETRRALDEHDVDMLVVAGDEVITSALAPEWHLTVQEKIVASIRLDARATEQEIVAATMPLVAQAEREREERAVEALSGEVGEGESGHGAAGAEQTLMALQAGQVETLLVVDDFSAAGWADFRKPVFGVGAVPAQHPTGGDPAALRPVALEEEMVRLATRSGAQVQIIHTSVVVDLDATRPFPGAGGTPPRSEAASRLDAMGGVGALLRFAPAPGAG